MKSNKFCFYLFVLFLFLQYPLFAKEKVELIPVPDSLSANANAVIRLDETNFEYLSPVEAVLKKKRTVTILNVKGKNEGNIVLYCDKFTKLKSFKGQIIDKNAQVLRKIKQKDLIYTEYSNDLASDAGGYYFESFCPSYPYTVEYEYEIQMEKGILGFPNFLPLSGSEVALQNASYTLTLPTGTSFRIKKQGNMSEADKKQLKGNDVYTWKIQNIKAIVDEPLSPPVELWQSGVMLDPDNFTYDGYAGSMKNWTDFGKWCYDLTLDRMQLPESLKQELIKMTKNAKTSREKVQILYDYLKLSTRYVSIQLGIGGFQPMLASKVAATGIGDCKALSNFMRAMLNAINIPSENVLIRLDRYRKNFISDFTSFGQTNHMILRVPLPNDTLWLECTNPSIPLGFVHDGIAGHDALVLTDRGGVLAKLPSYESKDHLSTQKAEILLNEDGSASTKVNINLSGFQYLWNYQLKEQPVQKQIDALRTEVHLTDAALKNIDIQIKKSEKPLMTITYDLSSSHFCSKTGNRLFVPINVFSRVSKLPVVRERKMPIEYVNGFYDTNEICFTIPKGYTVESVPKSVNLKSPYGEFNSTVEVKDSQVLVRQSFLRNSGSWPAADYNKLKDFIDFVNKEFLQTMVLIGG